MNLPHYPLLATPDRLQFEFTSEGPKGEIVKRIEYSHLADLGVWNLGFGDYDPDSDMVSDQTISDNGDGRKVLATVVRSLEEFLTVRPDAIVFFTGSTDRRTQVYSWVISKYWNDIFARFDIIGVTADGHTTPFAAENQYVAFLVYKK